MRFCLDTYHVCPLVHSRAVWPSNKAERQSGLERDHWRVSKVLVYLYLHRSCSSFCCVERKTFLSGLISDSSVIWAFLKLFFFVFLIDVPNDSPCRFYNASVAAAVIGSRVNG